MMAEERRSSHIERAAMEAMAINRKLEEAEALRMNKEESFSIKVECATEMAAAAAHSTAGLNADRGKQLLAQKLQVAWTRAKAVTAQETVFQEAERKANEEAAKASGRLRSRSRSSSSSSGWDILKKLKDKSSRWTASKPVVPGGSAPASIAVTGRIWRSRGS